MKNYKTCLLILAFIQLSYQYCHNSYKTTAQNGVCNCFQNFYSSNQNCVQCPNSSAVLSSGTKASDCSICPLANYYMTQAATSDQSATCVMCPKNSIFPPTSLAQTVQNESACTTCDFGYFKIADAVTPSADNGNIAKAAKCQKCPNNTYTAPPAPGPGPGPGSSSASITSCSTCSVGFYATSKPSDGQNANCSLCPNNQSALIGPGMPIIGGRMRALIGGMGQQPTYTFKDCNSCMKGYYNAESDPSKPINCQQCPGNTTTVKASSLNIQQCICSQNQYVTALSSPTSAASCSPCPTGSGRYSYIINIEGDESQCDVCLEGYYLITPYQESDGVSAAKGAQCQVCPKNSYSVVGTSTSPSSCSLCKQNYFMTKAADLTNSAECSQCPNNTGTLDPVSSVGDNTQCNVCAAGYYMTQQYQEGAAKTEKDCSSSQSSQQNSQLSFSSVIKISALIFLIVLI
ncbi:hypothetical protein ABPG73_017011 [Tetrahymena malaccensis]